MRNILSVYQMAALYSLLLLVSIRDDKQTIVPIKRASGCALKVEV